MTGVAEASTKYNRGDDAHLSFRTQRLRLSTGCSFLQSKSPQPAESAQRRSFLCRGCCRGHQKCGHRTPFLHTVLANSVEDVVRVPPPPIGAALDPPCASCRLKVIVHIAPPTCNSNRPCLTMIFSLSESGTVRSVASLSLSDEKSPILMAGPPIAAIALISCCSCKSRRGSSTATPWTTTKIGCVGAIR
jgi:hypothetical protein